MPVKEIKSARIIYFSGTGNTRKAAETFEECFKDRGIAVNRYSASETGAAQAVEEDLLLLVYAVYALNAPEAMRRCIDRLPRSDGRKAVVISASGGGEIFPNTACRQGCIRSLEKKGYSVVYEEMLVMPANVLVSTNRKLAVRLLEVLPSKVERIVSEVLSGVNRRKSPLLIDRLLSVICRLEWTGARHFGKRIKCGSNCSGCGWCAKNCPGGNIRMENGRPAFGNRCQFCLGCLYGCPEKALTPGYIKFVLIKEGYSLKELEKSVPLNEPVNVEELAKGYFWSGVRKYLQEDI